MGRLLDHILSPEVVAERERAVIEFEEKRIATIAQRKRDTAAFNKRYAENTVKESLTNLHDEGWHETERAIHHGETYPTSDTIVLEHPVHDYVLTYRFTMHEDDSDYPGDDAKITWLKCDVVEETIYVTVWRGEK
jgi:hypothetical protein